MEGETGEGHVYLQPSCAGLGRGGCGPTGSLVCGEGMVLSLICRLALATAKYFDQPDVRKQTCLQYPAVATFSPGGECLVLYVEPTGCWGA